MVSEVLKGERMGKSDVYSLFIIIYYMLFKEYPYKRNTECLIIKRIDDGLQIKKLMVKF